MVEKVRRSHVERDDSDSDDGAPPNWEVFVRDESDDPLRYAGTVAADTPTDAHENASRLFGWYAADIWVCPADSVERFSARGLESGADESAGTDDGTAEKRDGDGDSGEEPRVHPETASASDVNTL